MNGMAGQKCTLKIVATGGLPANQKTLGIAQDVELKGSTKDAETTTRGSNGAEEYIAVSTSWSVSVKALWVPTDEAFGLLETAWLNRTLVDVQLTDADGKGYSGTALISSFGRSEPLKDACTVPVELKGTGALAKLPAA